MVDGGSDPDLLGSFPILVFHRQQTLDGNGGPYPVGRALEDRHQTIAQAAQHLPSVLLDDWHQQIMMPLNHGPAGNIAIDFIKLGGRGDIGKHHRDFPLELVANGLLDFGPLTEKFLDRTFLLFHRFTRLHDPISSQPRPLTAPCPGP